MAKTTAVPSLYCFLLLTTTFLVIVVRSEELTQRTEFATIRYKGNIVPMMPVDTTSGQTPGTPNSFLPGQDLRFRLTIDVALTGHRSWIKSANVLFNATTGGALGSRVRVIPAYANRGSTGTRISCPKHTDFWAEYWGLSASVYQFGEGLTAEGFVTFSAPPFPFRVCVTTLSVYNNYTRGDRTDSKFVQVNTSYAKYTQPSAVTWSELHDMSHSVYAINATSPYLWSSAATMYAGDYAGIKIVQNGYRHPFFVPDSTNIMSGDQVKLVPAGFPCTYEHRATSSYCGRNVVDKSGVMRTSRCALEGSVRYGVGRVGTNHYNPFSETLSASRTLTYDNMVAGEHLVAYFRLPAAGTYDMCFSPRATRRFQNSTGSLHNAPVWTKIFSSSHWTCTGVALTTVKSACQATTRLVISTNADPLRWSSPHVYPDAWGVIKVYDSTGSATLNNGKATSWALSATREHYTTVGGDQFRLVPASRFTTDAITYGDVYQSSSGARLHATVQVKGTSGTQFLEYQRIGTLSTSSTYGSGESLRYVMQGTPDQGTALSLMANSGGGCFSSADDNYGNYARNLNGINSGMTSHCCTPSTSTMDCTSTSTCSLSDTDNEGVTASADLGGDPRASMAPWTYTSTAPVSAVWAYVRFPQSGNHYVCYRKAGTENWRVIQPAEMPRVGGSVLDMGDYKPLNYTYHTNDTQASTWGPILVHDGGRTLTTQNHNYRGSSATVVGSSIKIVKYTASCATDAGESETLNTKPGLMECDVTKCSGSATCANCLGSADDSVIARHEVTFYVRMPKPLSTGYYRVCFQNKGEVWIQLQDRRYVAHSLMTSPSKFNTIIAPSLDFILHDVKAATWAKVLFRRLANPNTVAFNANPNTAISHGDIVRLVPNVTAGNVPVHCDITWGATAAANGAEFALRNYDPSAADTDLGVYCISTSTTSTSRCYTGKVSPTAATSGDIGTYPYVDLDSTADGFLSDHAAEGAVAFLTIPAPVHPLAGYRLCYKPAHRNWVEVQNRWDGAPNPFFIAAKPSHLFSLGDSTTTAATQIYAGQYGYVVVWGATINLDFDVVKLVLDSTGGCDRPAAGSSSNGNTYQSFSWRSLTAEAARGGQAFVAQTAITSTATKGTRGTTLAARAYMTFPTVLGTSAPYTRYKVCYMSRSSLTDTTQNWHHLGSVNIRSYGIAYTTESQPYNGASVRVRFVTGGAFPLDTTRNGDSAKVVPITSPCVGPEWSATNRPNGVTSYHVGQEMDPVYLGTTTANTTMQELGVVDLGPSDLPATFVSKLDMTLPWVTSRIFYKVCYKPLNLPWVEIEQAPLAQQVYALGSDHFYTFDSGLRSYTITSDVLGQEPFAGAVYAPGIKYTDSVIAGASTAAITSSGNVSYFYVTYAAAHADYKNDMFKLVLYATEVVKGVYEPVREASCAREGVVTVAPGMGSTSTKPSLSISMPTAGGRYLVCYRKSGLNEWIQVPAATGTPSNPFRVIPSLLTFEYAAASAVKTLTVTDRFAALYNSEEMALGAIVNADTVYIVNASGTCGLDHSYAYPDGASSSLGTSQKNLEGTNGVYQTTVPTVPTAAGWYKICYKRTSSTIASGAATPKPYVRLGWYQLFNDGSYNGRKTPFFVTAQASRLRIDACPKSNLTAPIRTGSAVDISVSVLDTLGNVLPFAIDRWSYLVTAQPDAASGARAFALQNTRGECRAELAPQYGWDTANLRQWTSNGRVTFSLAVVSGCPAGVCSISFGASDSIAAPGSTNNAATDPSRCIVYVRNTPIARLSVWSGETTCHLDAPCNVKIAAFADDNGLAHTAADDVMTTISEGDGLAVSGNNVPVTAQASRTGYFNGGFFSLGLTFDVTNGALFSDDRTVTITFASVGKSVQHKIKVLRPKLTQVHIIDLYPENSTNVPNLELRDMFVRPFMVPSWEPSGVSYFPGATTASLGQSALTAAGGYHLVALQAYTAVLRPVDQYGRYINKPALLEPRKQITLTNTRTDFADNALLSVCDTEEVCSTPLGAVTFSNVKQKVSFRLKNARGCSKATPCKLTFKFDGQEFGTETSITTPVRSMATQLKTTCWYNEGSVERLGIGMTNACPSSSVEVGLTLKVEALDGEGYVDEYFDGNLVAAFRGKNILSPHSNIALTTIALLKSTSVDVDVPAMGPQKFSSGVVWVWGMTLTKPCSSGCDLQLMSDWGANLVDIGSIVINPSSFQLKCELTTPLVACTLGSTGLCEGVTSSFTYDTATENNNRKALIYKDTQLCASVTAINKLGDPTYYDTNWVMYWAEAGTQFGTATTDVIKLTDAGSTPSRVKAMRRGTVSFCFTVRGTTAVGADLDISPFRVRFAAQQFGINHWTKNLANGECSLGIFNVFGKRHIGNIAVSAVTEPLKPLVSNLPNADVSLYTQRSDAATSIATTLSFTMVDHYNKPFSHLDVDSSLSSYGIVISDCVLDTEKTTTATLASTCTSSTLSTQFNVILYTPSERQRHEGGVVTASVTSAAIAVTAPMSYSMKFDKWCLGCSLRFQLKSTSKIYDTYIIEYPYYRYPTATVTLNILMPASPTARVLAFRYGTSPWSTYWQTWDNDNQVIDANKGDRVLYKTSCLVEDKKTCDVPDKYFLPTLCDEADATASRVIAGSKTGTPVQMYVISATTTLGATSIAKNEPTCGYDGNCDVSTNIVGQIDILNSYDVTVSVGNQVLKCMSPGDGCVNDMTTAPRQTIAAFGTNVVDAIKNFAGTPRSTSIVVAGVYPSTYYNLTSDGKIFDYARPHYRGAFTATVSSNDSNVALPAAWTSTYEFGFRGPRIPQRFTILDAAKDVDCMPVANTLCHGPACAYNGYSQMATLKTINYRHAFTSSETTSVVPVNTPVPITVDVQDINGARVNYAQGVVSVELYSWTGCNNGGTLTVADAVNNRELQMTDGRVTAWVSFSAPCENCVLRFTFSTHTSQTSLYEKLAMNRAQLLQYTSPINVRDDVAGTGTHLIVMASSTNVNTQCTVYDRFTLDMKPVKAIGGAANQANLAVFDTAATGFVYAYNKIQTSAKNWAWYGNGGVLRSENFGVDTEHHSVAAVFTKAASTSLSFQFSRTCPGGCSVVVVYSVNGNAGSFMVRNAAGTNFVVSTASTKHILVGWRPRMVKQGTDFAMSLWHAGEGPNMPYVGVGSHTTLFAKPSLVVEDGTNGDGGEMTKDVIVLDRTEVHRFSIPRTVNRARISFVTDYIRLNVHTIATRLRVDRPPGSVNRFPFPMVNDAAFSVLAVDDLGFVDVRVGGFTGGVKKCFAYAPMKCPTPGIPVTCSLSANGRTTGGFMPDSDSFTVARGIPEFSASKDTMVDGIANTMMRFTAPARHAYPLFSVGPLTNAIYGDDADDRKEKAQVNIALPADGLTLATNQSHVSVIMLRKLTVYVGLVHATTETVSNSSRTVNYVATDANNLITLSYSADCPTRSPSTPVSLNLKDGLAAFEVVFMAPTAASATCVITASAGTGSGKCTTCTKQLSAVTVTSFKPTHWKWETPSAVDNAPGLAAGPYFGAMGRSTIFSVSLYGIGNTQGEEIRATSCDDPSTSVVEVCKLSVVANDACTVKPTISAESWDLTTGVGSVTVTWAPSADGSQYQCPMTVGVTSLGTQDRTLIVTSLPGTTPTVTVCQPVSLRLLTNVSSTYAETLHTGKPYSFVYATFDAHGKHCRGDSGASATTIVVDLVSGPQRTAVPASVMDIYNTNTTATGGWVAPNAHTAKAVGGYITLALVFTNSSTNLGLASVRLRARPSGIPQTTPLISGDMDTIIAASRLRFRPGLTLPKVWVMNRPLPIVGVEAIDGVNPQIAGVAQPNIARLAHEPGNNAAVFWAVDPLPATGFPLQFTSGQKEQNLVKGESTYLATMSTPNDGVYRLGLRSTDGMLSGTDMDEVYFQSETNLYINVKNFTSEAGSLCTDNCLLTNQTFNIGRNGTNFLNTTNLNAFNVSIVVTDALNTAVLGDSDSYIRVQLKQTQAVTDTTVTLSVPDAFVARSANGFYKRLKRGRAEFALGFVGSTLRPALVHAPVYLEFTCPKTIPAAVAGTSVDMPNPCAQFIPGKVVQTMPIRVTDNTVPSSVFDSPAVVAAMPTIKIPLTLTSLSQLNATDMKRSLAAAIGRTPGFGFISAENADTVLHFQACEVRPALFLPTDILGTNVCGPTNKCTASNPTACPTGAVICVCDAAAVRSVMLTRFLLQTSGGNSDVRVQAEVRFSLDKAVGFAATSESVIASTYTNLANVTATVLQQDTALSTRFGVNTTAVSSQLGNPTAAPTTAPTDTSSPTPSPTPPSGTSTPFLSAAVSTAPAHALLLALISLVALTVVFL
eukprot:PhM_4_TR15188/c0_g1_i1/m.41334